MTKPIVEIMRNMYPPSETYLQPFGLRLVNPKDGHIIKTFLLHDADLALSYCSAKERKRVKSILEEAKE